MSEIHLKLKSDEAFFANNLFLSFILKFCTEHDSITAMFCVKFHNDLTNNMDAMDKWNFVWFEFKMSLGGMSCIATAHRSRKYL